MLFIEILIIIVEIIFILKFKSTLIQLVLLVSFLPLITMIAFMNGLPVPGVLSLHRNVFTPNIINTGFVLLSLSNFALIGIL